MPLTAEARASRLGANSIAASHFVAMTLLPICCAKFLRAHLPSVTRVDGAPKAPVDRVTDRLAALRGAVVVWELQCRLFVTGVTVAAFVASLLLHPLIGRELFPGVDVGQFTVCVRVPSGTRIVESETLIVKVEKPIQETIPKNELSMLISNIGVLLFEFANRLREENGLSTSAAPLEAAKICLRPIPVSAPAAIFLLIPMAFGMGRGTEANIPPARAVVGGLTGSNVLVVVFVPVLYALLKRPACVTVARV